HLRNARARRRRRSGKGDPGRERVGRAPAAPPGDVGQLAVLARRADGPRLGTIEIRICDATTRLEDVVALTAYCQALVKHYCERHERGEEIPSYHRILTTENKWLAARYGLEAPLMDL